MGEQRTEASSKRLGWADIAKGISIILVVMMHSTLGTQEAMQAAGWLGPVVEFARPFRIPAFFLLAGFFFAHMLERPWREVLDRRVVHFVYFLGLWSVILLVVKDGVLMLDSPAAVLRWAAMSLIEPSGSLWFIHALALFAFAARLTASLPAAGVLAAAVILHVAAPETGWTAIDEFASRFVFFVAGCRFAPLVAGFAEGARGRPGLSAAAVLAAASMTAIAVWPESLGLDGAAAAGRPPASLVLGLFGALGLVIVSVALAQSRIAGPLAALGRKSLVVYLAFTIPMAATRLLLVKTGLIADVGLASLIVMVAAVSAPLLLEMALRRLGVRFLFEKPGWISLRGRSDMPRLHAAIR